jgi:hypothetical protein
MRHDRGGARGSGRCRFQWIKTLPSSAEDRETLLNGNTRRLLKL